MTRKDQQETIDLAIEQMLKILPEVVGNLMVANAMYSKITEEFYTNNKELTDHREIVQEVVSKIEGTDPTKSYSEILAEATPKIYEAVALKKKTNNTPVKRKSLDLKFEDQGNGAI